jgi:addiction module toxin, relE/stbE family
MKNDEIIYSIRTTNQFRKSLKRMSKRGYNLDLLDNVVNILAKGKKLPKKNKDHYLKGNYIGHRECHITPDWLLIYKITEKDLILLLTNTGSHNDLFE